jgi:hypothetical protein
MSTLLNWGHREVWLQKKPEIPSGPFLAAIKRGKIRLRDRTIVAPRRLKHALFHQDDGKPRVLRGRQVPGQSRPFVAVALLAHDVEHILNVIQANARDTDLDVSSRECQMKHGSASERVGVNDLLDARIV